jgi:hypothetical protein
MVIIQRNDCGASCFGQIIEQFRTPLFNIDLTIFVDKRLYSITPLVRQMMECCEQIRKHTANVIIGTIETDPGNIWPFFTSLNKPFGQE